MLGLTRVIAIGAVAMVLAVPAPALAQIDVPITLHVVRRSDGSGGLPATRVAAALADANAAFADLGIVFCRTGPTRFIDDDAFFLDIDTLAEVDALRQTDVVPDSINVWFTENLATEGGATCGVSSFTFDPVQGIVMANGCTATADDASSFAHELGHYLDLFDTSETMFGVECVTGINCATAGDLVCDTAASPDLDGLSGCVYANNVLGPCPGDTFYDPDPANVMATSDPACRAHFTPGQSTRALATLSTLRPELTVGCGDFATRLFVDASALGGGDGTSWDTAYHDLQDAIDAAALVQDTFVDIWVAAGTYRPDRGTGDRDLAFTLGPGVAIFGGFAGIEETLEERDIDANPTRLSGDLAGDDVEGAAFNHVSILDNSVHVVFAEATDETTRLDGLVIAGGAALGAPSPASRGGGLFVNAGVIVIHRCEFEGNRAIDGGAVATSSFPNAGEILAAETIFRDNMALLAGGAVYNENAVDSSFDRCTFRGNLALTSSGGAVRGGGSFRSCLFTDNVAQSPGGGLYVRVATTVTGCTFSGNESVTNTGGGVYHSSGGVLVAGCVLWQNLGVTSAEQGQVGGTGDVEFSCVEGLDNLTGSGNIGADPLFADPGAGDYRLGDGSPCINAGPLAPVNAGEIDLDGTERIQHCRIDMGAYESPMFAVDCNGNGTDDNCDLIAGVSLDCNGNGVPDECDIDDGTEVDCDGSGVPDACEILSGVVSDCDQNGVPDDCDLAEGAPDCNENGVPDNCDLATVFRASSGPRTPFGNGFPVIWTVDDLTAPLGDGTLTLTAHSDLFSSNEWVTVDLDSVGLGTVFQFSGADCATVESSLDLSLALIDMVFADGDATVTVTASGNVDPFQCETSFLEITLTYPRAPASDDVDGNGVPDECECPGDCAEPADGQVGVDDLVAVILAWGTSGGPCDFDANGTVDVLDLIFLLSAWGPCP